MLNFLIGSVEENAKRELGSYDPVEGRKRDLGDIIGDALTGRKKAIDDRVKELHIEKLKNAYGSKLDRYRKLPGVNIDAIGAGTKKEDLDALINRYENRANEREAAVRYAAQNRYGPDQTRDKTTDEIYSLVSQGKKTEEQKETGRLELRADKQAAEARLERLEERLDARRERMADRQADRELQMFKMKQDASSRKADLFKALFGLGTAFMI